MNALTKINPDHYHDEEDDNFLVIVASWENELDNKIQIQDFILNGESFIPLFSNVRHFRDEVAGSGFENSGVLIRKDMLVKILHGNETLILNPGSENPTRLTVSDIR